MITNNHSEDNLAVPTEHGTSLVPFRPAFPASYDLPTTKADVQRLIGNSPARPPAEIRQRLWFEAFGNEEWERLQKQAQLEYEAARKEHKRECLRVTKANRQIDAENAARKLALAREDAFYEEEVRRFEKDLNPEMVAAKLTVVVLESFLRAKPAVRKVFNRLWTASESRLWPYPGDKPKHIDYPYFSSRETRCKALLACEKGGFVFLTPPSRTSFIEDIKNIQSPLVFKRHIGQSTVTYWAREKIYLHDFGLYRNDPKEVSDFDWIWERLENGVQAIWGRLINIEFNDDWTFADSSLKEFNRLKLASDHPGLRNYIDAENFRPKPPSRTNRQDKLVRLPTPAAPTFQPPEPPTPPPVCYDYNLAEEHRVVLQGALLKNIEDNLREARQWLYAKGTLRPYFLFGGIPFPFSDGEIRHYLSLGQSGSGKSTVLHHLMSQFLPLTKRQTKDIIARSKTNESPKPRSSHEWSRSLTFQAVVYNAKTEYVPVIEAFGFRAEAGSDTDLFILDPRDSRCYAWDMAADIESNTDAEDFAAMLVPITDNAGGDDKDKIWQLQARRIIAAVIMSLRNLALKTKGRQTWTFHDVLVSLATPEKMQYVLQHHDTPDEIIAQLIDLSAAQASSIYMSVTGYVSQFRSVAEQWKVAQKHGRTISLKEWAQHGCNTVLVLPNTPEHESFGPLNRALITALRKIVLTEKYSLYRDAEGVERAKMRYIFMDEFGDAGNLHNIQELFTQGRSFGVCMVAGLIQLSALKKVYGDTAANTILGQFSYNAFLKTKDPETQEWMSKHFGEKLEELQKQTHTEGTSHDKTTGRSDGTTSNVADGIQLNYSESDSHSNSRTDGTNNGITQTVSADPKVKSTRATQEGANTSTTHQDTHGTQAGIGLSRQTSLGSTRSTNSSEKSGTNKSKATTTELRKDFNIYPSEFGLFPNPKTTGLIGGAYEAPPFVAGWRADLPFAALEPEYERKDAIDETTKLKEWPNVLEVSRATGWTQKDYERLGLEPLAERTVIMYQTESGVARLSSPLQERKLLTQQQSVEAHEEAPTSYLDKFEFEEE